jgi:hypothetical protein
VKQLHIVTQQQIIDAINFSTPCLQCERFSSRTNESEAPMEGEEKITQFKDIPNNLLYYTHKGE